MIRPPGYDDQGNKIVPPAAPAAAPSPFTAETLVKNPELAAILKKLYADIGGISTDPTKNQTVLQRNTKLPEVEAAGQAALQTQQADANNNAQSIADFAKTWLASQPAATAQAQQESGAIGRLYTGEYAKELADNRRRAGILSTQNLARRLGQFGGSQNLGNLGRGGVTNSFADAQTQNEVARASLARDMEFAGQERTDIQDIQARQSSNAGLQQKLTDAVLQRLLVPVQASQSSAAADLYRLGGVSNILSNNSVFTPQTRSGLVGNQLNLAQMLAQLRQGTNWDYVKGAFDPQMPGVQPQQPFSLPNPNRRSGGGNNSGPTMQDVLDAINSNRQGGQGNQGGQDGPMLGPPERPNRFDPPPGVWRNPNNDVSTPESSRADQIRDLVNRFADQGVNQNDTWNWLRDQTQEQLDNVWTPDQYTIPEGGYE